MQTQLACGRMSATRVLNPPAFAGCGKSHVAVLGNPRTCQRFQVRVARSEFQRGKQIRFAALSRNEAVEVAQLGLKSSEEGGAGAGRGEEGLVSTVGTPVSAPVFLQDWFKADKQLVVTSFTAFVTAGFTAILVIAAIPSLLAIKKAAEALEKLADTAREELPGTMAAIRLSGMEISDLTMELNDLGQEISKGVRSSARVLSSAETGMRQAGGIASNVWQEQAIVPVQAMRPLVARTARQMRDSLIQTRTLVRNLQLLSRVSGWIGSLQARTPILIINSDKQKKQKS